MESGMDFDREVSEALEYQARTTALLKAVVAKDKKERERRPRGRRRRRRGRRRRQRGRQGRPRQRGRQGSQVQVRARAAAQPVQGLRRQRHLRARAQGLPPRELAVPEDGGSSEGCG